MNIFSELKSVKVNFGTIKILISIFANLKTLQYPCDSNCDSVTVFKEFLQGLFQPQGVAGLCTFVF